MKTQKLGRTGMNLTTIGLGTWAMGGGGWAFGRGPQDDHCAKAVLTDSLSRERVEKFATDDHRRRDAQFQEPALSANLQLVEGLKRLALKHGKAVSHLAIAWVLRRAEVTSAIVGARSASQIEHTLQAAEWKLAADDLALIEDLLKQRRTAL